MNPSYKESISKEASREDAQSLVSPSISSMPNPVMHRWCVEGMEAIHNDDLKPKG